MSQFDYIRDYYGIAIEKGMHVTDLKGRRGVIVGATSHVKVQLEGLKGAHYFHPQSLNYPALNIIATGA